MLKVLPYFSPLSGCGCCSAHVLRTFSAILEGVHSRFSASRSMVDLVLEVTRMVMTSVFFSRTGINSFVYIVTIGILTRNDCKGYNVYK